MRTRKQCKRTAQGRRMTDPDVRPLDQGKRPLNCRKGLNKTKFEEIRGDLNTYQQTRIDYFR